MRLTKAVSVYGGVCLLGLSIVVMMWTITISITAITTLTATATTITIEIFTNVICDTIYWWVFFHAGIDSCR